MVISSFFSAAGRFSPTKYTSILTILTGISMQALTLVTGVLAARSLGVEGRGVFAACTLMPLLIISLGNLGGPVAATYLVARDPSRAPMLARNAVVVTVVSSAVLIPLSVIITSLITNQYGDLNLKVFLFSLLAIPTMMLGIYLNAINQGANRLIRFNLIRLLVPLIYCLLLLGLLLSGQANVNLALSAWVVSASIFFVASAWGFRDSFRQGIWLDRTLLRSTYHYGLRAHLGSVAPIDSFRLDLALVVALLTPRDAGLYAVAVAVASVVRSQASSMGMITMTAVAREPMRVVQLEVARKYFLRTLGLVLAVAVLLTLGARSLVSVVYGDGFSDASTTLIILVWAMVIASARQAMGDTSRALGSPGTASISEAISWIAGIPAILLVHHYGLNGAAFAVLLAYSISLLAMVLMPTSREFLGHFLGSFIRPNVRARSHLGGTL